MSCYLVEKKHIDYLVSAALSRRLARGHSPFTYWNGTARVAVDRENATETGRMLWLENCKSVYARYEDRYEIAFEELAEYEFTPFDPATSPDPVQVLKAVHCYEYQACEHDGWERSHAFRFCQNLKHAAECALIGYEAAEWGAPKTAAERKAERIQ